MDGKLPVTVPVRCQQSSVLESLVEAKAQVDVTLEVDIYRSLKPDPGFTLFYFAARNCFVSSVKSILAAWPADALAKNQAGLTVMDFAPVEVKCYINKNVFRIG